MNELLDNDTVNQSASKDIDKIFDNLNKDIDSVNKFINNLNNQKKANQEVFEEIEEERKKLEQARTNFESNMNFQLQEIDAKKLQLEKYFVAQRDALSIAEEEFKRNMDVALSEFELIKKESELSRESLSGEKEQFENYKKIEIDRIRHDEDVLSSEKEQFEKYKDVTLKKIELENKNLEKKCEKLKDIISQFNINFKPIKDEE